MMRLFPRLAAVNLYNNRTAYLPYLLTGSVCVAMFYIILTFAISPEMAAVPYATGAVALFLLGSIIIAAFSAALLLYANAFLIRRRKREFGLYSVLGMAKRHVGVVLLFESLYACAASLLLGLVFGTLLGQLLFAALTKLLTFDVTFQLAFCDDAAAAACAVFGVLFAALYLYDLAHLYRASPVALLHGEQTGEREPRSSLLLTLVGLASLGGGYAVAVLCTDAVNSLQNFFLAVLLVILGTFCLFTSGSIRLLKALRRSKKFYYKPENFISVSGMLYRMKRNAAGLASVCILFTMLLVTVSTTACLYLGQEASLRAMYPAAVLASGEDLDAARAALDAAGADGALVFRTDSVRMALADGALSASETTDGASVWYASVLPLADYNAMTGEDASLGENECLLYAPALSAGTDVEGFAVAGEARLPQQLEIGAALGNSAWIVLPDTDAALRALGGGVYSVSVFADAAGGEDAERALGAELAKSGAFQMVACRADIARDWYALYGCFLFLGLFFGALFLVAMGLILYYKQLSEGVDDRARFDIMQKVGLSRDEAGRAVRRQILLVFFLPLAAAALHMLFAYNIICNILYVLGVTDRVLFAALCCATFLVCAAVYYALYRLTSRTYSRMVRA